MKIAHVSFADVPQLAKTDLAYATNNPNLRPFFHYTPSVEAFEKVMEDKSQELFSRNILVEVLENQYRNLPPIDAVVGNIAALKNKKTFTIVTAHQPLLFTGPLYFIYKIIAVINVTKKLKSVYSDFHFVPVFVIGGEDHDFEEVNHAHLFGKKITWQNDEKGAVGFMKSALLAEPLAELTEILGNSEAAQKIISLLKDAYLNTEKYVEATLSLLHHLFGADGLVVLSMHHSALKRLFIPVMRDELLHQTSKKIIDKTIEELSVLGYKTQAAPRDINLFYLREQLRERIVKEGAGYKVWNTDLVFSEAEIVDELENFPERFSPNVVLRPLFQEIVLPNLAYVGGGGELAYWLERMSQFKNYNINFPMLIRRTSALWIDKNSASKMKKLGIEEAAIFQETDKIVKDFVQKNSQNDLSLAAQKADLSKIFDQIERKAADIDATLSKAVAAEKVKQLAAVEQLETRLVRAEKQKYEVSIQQIKTIKEKLFPAGNLQERHENFTSIYAKQGDVFFETLRQHIDCFDARFLIIKEE